MPTRRLTRSSTDSQRSETKENNINARLMRGKVVGAQMARKRRQSASADSNNSVLRVSQEANSHHSDDDIDSIHTSDSENGDSSHVDSPVSTLDTQSLQAGHYGRSKRRKVSPENKACDIARLIEDYNIVAAGSGDCERSSSQLSVDGRSLSPAVNTSAVSSLCSVL